MQARLVKLLHAAYANKRRQDARARELIDGIDDVLHTELSVPRYRNRLSSMENRVFRKRFSDVIGQRWDPNHALYMDLFLREIEPCPFPVRPLKDSLAFVQYGISERATAEEIGVPMLRMLNLQGGEWDLSNMKYIAMSDEERGPYLLGHGDILFNRTNSKELVGKCNVFDLEGEYVFASYLMRARLKDNADLCPDYVVAYMACSLGRLQIDAVSRQIAGMTNINAEELRELLVPIPPRYVQDRIIQKVRQIRQKASELRAQATAELRAATAKMERLLLHGAF